VIALSLPEQGHPFGWSVASTRLTEALKKLTEVIEVHTASDYPEMYDCPLLHAIQGVNLLPLRPQYFSKADVGYCFIEDNVLVKRYMLNAPRYFDKIVAGSTWCRDMLADFHLPLPVHAILQGVGPEFFEIQPREKDDRFIVFSGGKYEPRKGQDIVLAAMRVFMGLHKDAWFSPNWHNPWNYGRREAWGCDPARIIGSKFAAVPHAQMPDLYRCSDIGLFPNRCEAGTNLVMMEYMASGRPVIATYATGHKDVLEEHNPLNLTHNGEYLAKAPDGSVTGVWVEPDLDEILANLETAYRSRDSLPVEGARIRETMRKWTWERCAREFLEVLTS